MVRKGVLPGYREVSVWAPRYSGLPFKVIKMTDNNMNEKVC